MSFSATVKKELASVEVLSACCVHAQVYGLVIFSHFSSFDVSVMTENPDTARLYKSGMQDVCGVTPKPETENESKKIILSVLPKNEKVKVYESFGHSMNELTLRINMANIQDECCKSAFLRGVFLACGTMTDPNKNYHLEFVISHKKLCTDLIKFLEDADFSPKYIYRKGYHVVYFKESEGIEDILTFMGATESSLQLMGIKMHKDVINKVNRKLNFEMSNINKVVNAGNKQADAVRLIEKTSGINSLPENLREIAKLRLENPDASLKELGEMMNESISRSGLNHRLAKILEISQGIKDSD